MFAEFIFELAVIDFHVIDISQDDFERRQVFDNRLVFISKKSCGLLRH